MLNHLYEVRRFIARGGMGEVFEGVNITQDDERVAIKVILPHLAADPNVLAMFRKEARILTRLSHPALVHYRIVAQEPDLGVVYIVTEYIDGASLASMLRRLDPSPREVRDLLRHLAEGLRVAHAAGAVHRDIAPDNVMLEGGRLENARIIDFGIVKNLEPGSGTVVGTGFAGKLNYVAPEQLGDFGRNVGPWTDVYSLGLTALALIERREVDMGATIAEAIDQRRRGPDLSRVPSELRPVLAAMLEADPTRRLQSMDAVLAGLANVANLPGPPPVAKQPGSKAFRNSLGRTWRTPLVWIRKHPRLAAGSAAGTVVALILVAWVTSSLTGEPVPPAPTATPIERVTASANTLLTAQTTIASGVARLPCSWVDATDVTASGPNVAASFSGVSGRPAEAQTQIARLLEAHGLRPASLDFRVSQIDNGFCGIIDALAPLRSQGAPWLHLKQPSFEVDVFKAAPGVAPETVGKIGATAIIDVTLPPPGNELAFLGLTADGQVEPILTDRKSSEEELDKLENGDLRLEMDTSHVGWSGIVMLTGRGPFDPKLLQNPPGPLPAAWAQRLQAEARAKGWKAEIAWYQTVDAVPNT